MDRPSNNQEPKQTGDKKLSNEDIMKLFNKDAHTGNKQKDKQKEEKIGFDNIFTKQIGSDEKAIDSNQAKLFGEMVRFLKEEHGVEIFGFGSAKNSGQDLTAVPKNLDTSEPGNSPQRHGADISSEHHSSDSHWNSEDQIDRFELDLGTLTHTDIITIKLQKEYKEEKITLDDLQKRMRSIKVESNQNTDTLNKSETYEHSEIFKRGQKLVESVVTGPGPLMRDISRFLKQAKVYVDTKCKASEADEEGNRLKLLLGKVTTALEKSKNYHAGYEHAGKAAGLASMIYEELKDELPPWPSDQSSYISFYNNFLAKATERLKQATQRS